MNLDSWQPSASLEMLRKRAQYIANIRHYFTKLGFLEVETPVLGHFGVTDVYLNNIKAPFRGEDFCLQTSPEYHMKRLLAAGSGPVFQIARVFRDDEKGRWHNPEFTLLEWYTLDVDHHHLMEEVDLFLQATVQSVPMIKKTYGQVFMESCALNPFHASIAELRAVLAQYELDNVLAPEEEDRDQYLFLLMTHIVEPFFAKEQAPVAIYDFPASQASLAQIRNGFAERFEVYYKGIELANGFHELTDAKMQRKRFIEDQKLRKKKGLPAMQKDTYLLEALEHGIPPCSGVALGVDRLLALTLEQNDIAKVISFAISCA